MTSPITIFSPMRPFQGNIGEVQLNAIRCWLALRPKCEVIVFDDEEGTTLKATHGLDIKVVEDVRRSRLGAPLLDDLFRLARIHATRDILAYNTADVLLPADFAPKIAHCHHLMAGKSYMAIGSRVDMTRPMYIDFDKPDWFEQVRVEVATAGVAHGHTAGDLWVYPKSFDMAPPPFPIGRHLTDGWAIYSARCRRIPVIDLTAEILLVHQVHDRPAKRNPLFHEEQLECVRLFANAAENALSVIDADWVYNEGHIRRPLGLRRIHAAMSLFRPYRWLVGRRRKRKLPHLYCLK